MRKIFFLMLVLPTLFLTACSEDAIEGEEYPYGHYEDDKMIGEVMETNKEEGIIQVDISEWEKRDHKGPDMTDEGYHYSAMINDGTVFAYEDGTEATMDDLKIDQKILVNPPRGDEFEGIAEEIILLDMTYEEKYWRLLSRSHGFNIMVMYHPEEYVPPEMGETMFANVMDILEGTDISAGAGWLPYEEDYIVDFKEELDIEEFPVILVFDTEKLLFKTYDVEELYAYFEEMK
ncbi:hypothetical protein [Ornithinibacillus halotolerans]|uniref:Uncharacterized protein n=1 Tax=Ornithinibacillus halotolerans TaxID=1274357 RepID=A0A916RL22_9BACI|nr:hypothetical protein [Ornithinibacillus halotolerans]GGA60174.1 hypothetical protein GCM10008025_00240 [Ornithinibacillus halotolerans]